MDGEHLRRPRRRQKVVKRYKPDNPNVVQFVQLNEDAPTEEDEEEEQTKINMNFGGSVPTFPPRGDLLFNYASLPDGKTEKELLEAIARRNEVEEMPLRLFVGRVAAAAGVSDQNFLLHTRPSLNKDAETLEGLMQNSQLSAFALLSLLYQVLEKDQTTSSSPRYSYRDNDNTSAKENQEDYSDEGSVEFLDPAEDWSSGESDNSAMEETEVDTRINLVVKHPKSVEALINNHRLIGDNLSDAFQQYATQLYERRAVRQQIEWLELPEYSGHLRLEPSFKATVEGAFAEISAGKRGWSLKLILDSPRVMELFANYCGTKLRAIAGPSAYPSSLNEGGGVHYRLSSGRVERRSLQSQLWVLRRNLDRVYIVTTKKGRKYMSKLEEAKKGLKPRRYVMHETRIWWQRTRLDSKSPPEERKEAKEDAEDAAYLYAQWKLVVERLEEQVRAESSLRYLEPQLDIRRELGYGGSGERHFFG